MSIRKILFLIVLLSFFASCKQTTSCNRTLGVLDEKENALLGVYKTKFQYSENGNYQAFPHVSEKVHTYEYLAFSETGKAYFVIRKIDYKNSDITLKKLKTFDFVAKNGAMKWIYEDGEQTVDFLIDEEVLTVILRDNDGKVSISSYQKTKSVLLEDIQNAEY